MFFRFILLIILKTILSKMFFYFFCWPILWLYSVKLTSKWINLLLAVKKWHNIALQYFTFMQMYVVGNSTFLLLQIEWICQKAPKNSSFYLQLMNHFVTQQSQRIVVLGQISPEMGKEIDALKKEGDDFYFFLKQTTLSEKSITPKFNPENGHSFHLP